MSLGLLSGLGQGLAQVGQNMHSNALAERRTELQARLSAAQDDINFTRQLGLADTQFTRQQTLANTLFERQKTLSDTEYKREFTVEDYKHARRNTESDAAHTREKDRWEPYQHKETGAWMARDLHTGDVKTLPGQEKGADGRGSGSGWGKELDDNNKRFLDYSHRIAGQDGFAMPDDLRSIRLSLEDVGQTVVKYAALTGIDRTPEQVAADVMHMAFDSGKYEGLRMSTARQMAAKEMADKAPQQEGMLSRGKNWVSGKEDTFDADSKSFQEQVNRRAASIQRQTTAQLQKDLARDYFGVRDEENQPGAATEQAPSKVAERREALRAQLADEGKPLFAEGDGRSRPKEVAEWIKDVPDAIINWSNEAAQSNWKAVQEVGGTLSKARDANTGIAAGGKYDPINPSGMLADVAGPVIDNMARGVSTTIKNIIDTTEQLFFPTPDNAVPKDIDAIQQKVLAGTDPQPAEVARVLRWLEQPGNEKHVKNKAVIAYFNLLLIESEATARQRASASR